MPRSLFYRHVRMYRVLKTFNRKSWPQARYIAQLDVCGGTGLPETLSSSRVRDDLRGDALADNIILNNKDSARCRKMRKVVRWTNEGMELPLRGDNVDGLVPLHYKHFAPCQEITTLAWLHPHMRDRFIRFVPEGHVYYIRDKQTNGSVTGLIHFFAQGFDADNVVACMTRGNAWPRPGYLRSEMDMAVLKRIRQVDSALLLALLESPRNDLWICERVRLLKADFPDIALSLSMDSEQIKEMWETNRADAALNGTYMHFLFEAYLNGYTVPMTSPEFSLLQKFLRRMVGWRAYRTEWTIFGEDENLAGSIDLCAIDQKGNLALIDWKRTSGLRSRYTSTRRMLPPLSHVPDCAGFHYRLQLNVYRYLVEKYYGFHVSMMLVVGTHPDNQSEPFIDEVPRLEEEVASMLASWQRDTCGGTSQQGFNSGGCENAVSLMSAMTGEFLCACSIDPADAHFKSLADLARAAATSFFFSRPFCFDVLLDDSPKVVPDAATWEVLGRPRILRIVQKPEIVYLSEELFDGIEAGDFSRVRHVLGQGQDPNAVIQQPALHQAIQCGNSSIVKLLLQGKANPDFVDHRGYCPLRLAIAHDDSAAAFHLLLDGANPLMLDPEHGTPFSWASPGLLTGMIIHFCRGDEITPKDLLVRHLNQILHFCNCPVTLRSLSVTFAKQMEYWDAYGGSETSSLDASKILLSRPSAKSSIASSQSWPVWEDILGGGDLG
eukprot:Skav232521  [mRNA]  locus=scaffold1096:935294:937453:- [translate_table: standard]